MPDDNPSVTPSVTDVHYRNTEQPPAESGIGAFLPADEHHLSLPKEVGVYARLASGHLSNPDRWPISPDQRVKAVARLIDIMEKAKDTRAVARAGQVLAMFDRINLEAIRDTQPQRLDITTGGQPLRDLSAMTPEQIRARMAALESLESPPQ